jgi:hypothetical protein
MNDWIGSKKPAAGGKFLRYFRDFFSGTLPFLKPYLTKDVFFRISAGRETRNQLHLALSIFTDTSGGPED